ncbi:MAG: hypothetical protein R2798_02155 [Chitinophagales bacterium]|nr:hypothetical protein [Bacteroidota bacterium]
MPQLVGNSFAGRLVQFIADTCDKISEIIAKMAEITTEYLFLARAFYMGLLNGLLSTINLLVFLLRLLVQALLGDNHKAKQEARQKIEYLEDFWDIITANIGEFLSGMWTLATTFDGSELKALGERLGEALKAKVATATKAVKESLAGYTIYDWIHFAGSFIFDIVVGVALTVFTAGFGAFAALGRSEKIAYLLKQVVSEIVSAATFGIVDFLQLLRGLIVQFIRKANQGFKTLVEWIEDLLRKKGDELAEEIKDFSDLERKVADLFDKLGGRLLDEKELKLLKAKLKAEFGVDLRLIDKEIAYQKLPITVNGKTKWVRSSDLLNDWDRRGVVGKFHEGPPPMIILRAKDASELTVFHEKVHMSVYLQKLPKMHIVDEEILVFEEILKAKDTYKWTDVELISSYNYVNDIINDANKKSGKNFPKYSNEFMEQLIINKSLNIK